MKILVLLFFKPAGFGILFSVMLYFSVPLNPVYPDLYELEIYPTLNQYFNHAAESFTKLLPIFFITYFISFIYYFITNHKLILDLGLDIISSEKTLGQFRIETKYKKWNKYYIETNDSRFVKLKTNKTVYDKIIIGEDVDLIISKSNRIYRYNPLIENFRIDKLI
ncbi:hypothetical protein [Salinimicrobium gaetbulicola]|uniref:Uncharacterized protein n=1 Tax=Salinimicrobium gaetbulicola TaxID=999702 RepID=A0ABW3IBN5_9FLAO